jgi:hypothetical protein
VSAATRMTFQQKLMVITALAALIGAAVVMRTAAPTASSADRPSRFGGAIGVCLAIVAGALVAVGIVSDTPLRHAVQVTPVVIAIVPAIRRSAITSAAAAPIFGTWLLIMGAIWLFLLGVARIFTGRFTAPEIVLTLIIGLGSLAGLVAAYRRGTTASAVVRFSTVVVFALLQFAAMWLSVQPSIARR